MKKYNIAIVGASGKVGHEIAQILSERDFPCNNVYALASRSSVGKKISFGEKDVLTIDALDDFDFSKVDIVISAVSNEVTKSFAAEVVKAGAILIDKSSLFRQDPTVPLIVPEVNGHLLKSLPVRKIISSPNCVTIPLVVALNPLNNAAKIKRIVLSTYQSVSGAGKDALTELYDQTKGIFLYKDAEPKVFEKQIAFNILPKIDHYISENETAEEEKIRLETKRLIGEHVNVTATCVRVPVFIGHCASVNIEFERKLSANEAYELLEEAEGVTIISQKSTTSYISPVEAVGDDTVFVSRIRDDLSHENSINLWITCDNIRKGAATNAVQIAELVIESL